MVRSMPVKVGDQTRIVFGGPYVMRPPMFFGVNMAAEIDLPANVHVPTEDFSVPDEAQLRKALYRILLPLYTGRNIYVGCRGGIGRTGLFMAALARVLGEDDPVGYVRRNYLSYAVETKDQKVFVESFSLGMVPLAYRAMLPVSWAY